ncbi:hypothetical protein MPSEU_000867500 [Mayamaea pseudoterrestris]|nr:hypothetical protein MPSEU_000867500 [Mayamaea pseudoterrestris]
MPQLRHLFSAAGPTSSTMTFRSTQPATYKPSTAAATTPIRRTRLNSKDGTPRRRLNSRDIQSPASMMNMNSSSDSMPNMYTPGFPSSTLSTNNNTLGWCLVYLTAVGLLQLLAVALVGPIYSTTLTNVLHTLLTILSLHWIKGQPFDDTGSQAGWTLWEQLLLAGQQEQQGVNLNNANTMSSNSNHRRTLQSWLLLVPTLLTYAACVQCQYNAVACVVNVVSWVVALVAKLPAMVGVRIFGINRTVGIDDDVCAAVNKKDTLVNGDNDDAAAAAMFMSHDNDEVYATSKQKRDD